MQILKLLSKEKKKYKLAVFFWWTVHERFTTLFSFGGVALAGLSLSFSQSVLVPNWQ